MIVFDTDIVTLISYGKNEKLRERIEVLPEDQELAVTIITFMEVLQGRFDSILKAAKDEDLLKAMDRFRTSRELLSSFRLLEIDASTCRHFADLTGPKKRAKMKRGDMLIACLALSYNALLVTRNEQDYKGVGGLRVENWAD